MTNTTDINSTVQSLIEAADNFDILPVWHFDENDQVFANATKIYSDANTQYVTMEFYLGKAWHKSLYCVTGGDDFASAYNSFLELIGELSATMEPIK